MISIDPLRGLGSTSRRPTGQPPGSRHRPQTRRRPANGERRRATVIAPSGEMDMARADDLQYDLDRAIERDTDIVVDLTDVTLLDCCCLSILVRARQRALRRGRTIRLAAPSRSVTRVLRLTGLDAVFATYGDTDRALACTNAAEVDDRPPEPLPRAERSAAYPEMPGESTS